MGFGGGGLVSILIVVALIGGGLWVIRSIFENTDRRHRDYSDRAGNRNNEHGGTAAEEILRERYARGEISGEEYHLMYEELRKSSRNREEKK